ncbi:MAG: hypothetical protein MUO82_01725 [Candidatus Thermoplasmatota archaeon]|nr:hypothetical protein [Candidatus Thermoplasmatota archaeon]
MAKTDILKKIENKEITKDALVKKIKNNFSLLPEIISGVSSRKASIRYGCSNALTIISEENPKELYPYMDFFIKLLDSDYRILKWASIVIIANLTKVDTENKFDTIFDKYYGYLDDEYMVTVANIVGNSGKIALAKPYLTQKITDKLLKIENISIAPHLSEECKRVIAGHAIKTFDMFFPQIEQKDKVISFVKKHLNSSREILRTESEKFLEKWD